jgi:hypothetical protein
MDDENLNCSVLVDVGFSEKLIPEPTTIEVGLLVTVAPDVSIVSPTLILLVKIFDGTIGCVILLPSFVNDAGEIGNNVLTGAAV